MFSHQAHTHMHTRWPINDNHHYPPIPRPPSLPTSDRTLSGPPQCKCIGGNCSHAPAAMTAGDFINSKSMDSTNVDVAVAPPLRIAIAGCCEDVQLDNLVSSGHRLKVRPKFFGSSVVVISKRNGRFRRLQHQI